MGRGARLRARADEGHRVDGCAVCFATERTIEGELIPVFANGKHMSFRRKRNDALLMFVLRHYGKDAAGKRTTINYFSSRASAGATSGSGGSAAGAEASQTTVTTVITGGGSGEDAAARVDKAATAIEGFEGIALDDEARAEIMAALEACAAREQAMGAAWEASAARGFELAAEENTAEAFLALPDKALPWHGTLEPPVQCKEAVTLGGEAHWTLLGQEEPDISAALAALAPERRRVRRQVIPRLK